MYHARPEYEIRDRKLAALGFGRFGYPQYLDSRQWRNAKARFRASNERQTCAVCGSAGVDLHHRTYERLGEERPSDLVALCPTHHHLTHRLERNGIDLGSASDALTRVYAATPDASFNDLLIAALVSTPNPAQAEFRDMQREERKAEIREADRRRQAQIKSSPDYDELLARSRERRKVFRLWAQLGACEEAGDKIRRLTKALEEITKSVQTDGVSARMHLQIVDVSRQIERWASEERKAGIRARRLFANEFGRDHRLTAWAESRILLVSTEQEQSADEAADRLCRVARACKSSPRTQKVVSALATRLNS